MTVRILMTKDINGKSIDSNRGRQFSDMVYYQLLASNVPQLFTIPAGINVVFFRYSVETPADVFVGYNGGVVPTIGNNILLEDGDEILLEDGDNLLLESEGGGFIANGLAINPDVRWVKPGDILEIISPSNTFVGLELYAL